MERPHVVWKARAPSDLDSGHHLWISTLFAKALLKRIAQQAETLFVEQLWPDLELDLAQDLHGSDFYTV